MIGELFLLGIVSSVCSQSLHHAMTPEELHSIFSVKNHSEVPEYDVVPVSVVKSRKRRDNVLYMSTEKFGKNIRAWLYPTDGILADRDMPIHFLSENLYSNYPNFKVRTFKNLMEDIKSQLYENELYATTLAVKSHRNGKRSVRGFIGDTHIQPVPSHLMDHAKRHRRSVKGSLDEKSDHENYHIVRKIPKLEGIHYSPPIEAFSNSNRTRRSIRYQPVKGHPKIIYPQILVLVDYYILNQFKNDWTELIVYILSFWNGVDMRYRDIINPRVRLNINGIVISTAPNLLPYLHAGKFGEYAVDLDESLVEKAKWLKGEVLSRHIGYYDADDTYDVAVTMTQFTLCFTGSGCGILGLANVDGACTADNVGIVQDFGGFSGIMTTAHELGHTFGMNHDNRTSRHCDEEAGNVMAPAKTISRKSYDWSDCSLTDFHNFLNKQGKCLTNKPTMRYSLPKIIPGMMMNAHKQCEMVGGVQASAIDDSICTQLKCTVIPESGLPEAADGTFCGRGKVCLHESCIFVNTINK